MPKIYGNTVGVPAKDWPDDAKPLLIEILKKMVPEDQLESVNALEKILLGMQVPDAKDTVAILGTGVLGKIILGRSS